MELFRERLENILNRHHELYRLAGLIDWSVFEKEFGKLYAYGLSDEAVVAKWVENPYWQHFCGETYFQHQLPLDSSSMPRWRKRIGEKGCELVLAVTFQAGLRTGAVKESSLERVNVDTTVQPKAVLYPTDSRSYNRCRERLVRLAQKFGIKLRQSYARLGPRALRKASSYAHARQFKRAKKEYEG